MSDKTPTFHLGITMAGAVSAGAYTAGFMDYLLEALELWEEKKEINRKLGKNHTDYDKKIPMHDVCIDVVGGASAGGMVSVMTALSMYKDMPHIKEPTHEKTGNILYDSWVLLDDDLDNKNSSKTTFEKMLDTADLKNNTVGIESILNSNPIDRIAEKAFEEYAKEDAIKKLKAKPFISEDLRVLVTLCSLKGISFDVVFNRIKSAHFKNIPSHRMKEHMVIAHFKTSYNAKRDKNDYLRFNPYDEKSRNLIKKCTKGTGAFPIGLKARHFKDDFTKKYIESSLKRNLATKIDPDVTVNIKSSFFNFTNVDGGTINNEPYGEVVQVLEELNGELDVDNPMYGTIMIDPFPNFYDEEWDETPQNNIFEVIPKLYNTLREQVRVKRGDSFFNDNFRLLAFPIKWQFNGKPVNHPPLACGGLDGFGGFFDREFRIHDFFLGRNNARNFIRYFFSLEYDTNNLHPLFKDIAPEAAKEFLLKPRVEKGKTFLPVIPDVSYINDKEIGHTNPYFYDVDTFPKLDLDYFNSLNKPLKNRIKKMINFEVNRRFKTKWFMRNAIKLTTGYLSKKATKKITSVILDDFKKRKML
jgi:hypothetical protein